MKIGVIGTEDSALKIKKIMNNIFPEIKVSIYIEEKIKDAYKSLNICQQKNDGIIFTGIGVMKSILNTNLELIKPYEYIARDGSSILKVLWELKQSNQFPKKISIDVVNKIALDEMLEEFGVSFEKVEILPYSSAISEEEYIEFHKKNRSENNITTFITGFGSVYKALKEDKYNVFRLYPTSLKVRESVEKLMYKVNTQMIHHSSIVVQVVKLALGDNSFHQYKTLKKKGRFELELLEYVQEIQGSLVNVGKDEYMIFSTRGSLKGRSSVLNFLNIMKKESKHNFLIFSGIGYGTTSYLAEASARKALKKAGLKGESSLYIKDGDLMNGPMGDQKEVSFDIKIRDKNILKIAETTGINPLHIAKLIEVINQTGNREFSTQEVSNYLVLTERSARRILNKLIDSKYAILSGKEVFSSVGRPKKIVKLNF